MLKIITIQWSGTFQKNEVLNLLTLLYEGADYYHIISKDSSNILVGLNQSPNKLILALFLTQGKGTYHTV
jgi:hypothetical protein